MSLNKLASAIAKREGKKHQASVGDIREILSVFADIIAEQMCDESIEGVPAFEAFDTSANKKAAKIHLKKQKLAVREEMRAAKAAQPKTPKKKK